MPYDVRRLTDADTEQRWTQGAVAFGYRDRTRPDDWRIERPGQRMWGVFDGDRLVAAATDREQSHWYGGRLVPACGVQSVSVTPEARGRGLARIVITRLLADARDRGATIAKLFYTTPIPYRHLGWEEAGALVWTAFPTITLAGLRAPHDVRLRPAVAADVTAMDEVFREAARDGNGMMERSGPAFDCPAEEYLTWYDGMTVAIGPDGAIDGYASWQREPGYDATGRVTVVDFVARTRGATEALLTMLAGWVSVAPTITWSVPSGDPALAAVWLAGATVEKRLPWMLRMIDAAGAVAARGWPAHVTGQTDLDLVDDECRWNAGPHRLVLDGGHGRLEPGGTGATRITARGMALLYSGSATPYAIRRAGQLTGGDPSTDAFLRAATTGAPPRLHDYF